MHKLHARYALAASFLLAPFVAASCGTPSERPAPPDGGAGADASAAGGTAGRGGSGAGGGTAGGGAGQAGSGNTAGGGAAGLGGMAGTAGSAGGVAGASGGAAGAAGSGALTLVDPTKETLQLCPGGTVIDAAVLNLEPCPLCDDALCVPDALVSGAIGDAGSGLGLLADCQMEGGTGKCLPRSYVASVGNFLFGSCTSTGGAEGRCVNACIPQIADFGNFLPRDVCGENELCAPCYFPTDGSPSGACGFGCDPGPEEPPVLFGSCCNDLGTCIPEDLVPPAQASALGADGCAVGDLCSPTSFVDAFITGAVPPKCVSLSGAEGRCVPTCIEQLQSIADFLPQDICQTDEVCAPCYDPTSGSPTGACSLPGDMPVDPPVVYTSCCNGEGSCVDVSLIPANFRATLATDVCGGDGGGDGGDAGLATLCTPTDLVLGTSTPCTNPIFVDAGEPPTPGICISTCAVPVLRDGMIDAVVNDYGGTAADIQGDCPTSNFMCVPCGLVGQFCTPNQTGDAGVDASN